MRVCERERGSACVCSLGRRKERKFVMLARREMVRLCRDGLACVCACVRRRRDRERVRKKVRERVCVRRR